MHIRAYVVLVVAFNLHLVRAAKVTNKFNEEPLDVPEECHDLTYCSVKPASYPSDKLKNMFKNYRTLSQPKFVEKMQKLTFDNRIKDLGEKDNCEVVVTNEPLYMIRLSKEARWKTVVQVPENKFEQRVRVVRCKNANASCFTEFSTRPDFQTSCVQKYVTWELMVLGENNQTELLKSTLPSCCSCYYKPVGFATRLGLIGASNKSLK